MTFVHFTTQPAERGHINFLANLGQYIQYASTFDAQGEWGQELAKFLKNEP
jgi:hypothetical protein